METSGMTKKTILEERIDRVVTNILNEEKGISDMVEFATDRLINVINGELQNPHKYGEVVLKCPKGQYKTFGAQIMANMRIFGNYSLFIYFTIGVISSKEELEKAYTQYGTLEDYYFVNHPSLGPMLYIQCPALRNGFKPYDDLLEIGLIGTRIRSTLSHELKHAYQFFMSSGHLMNYKQTKIYDKAILYKEQGEKEQNDFKYLAGYFLYFASPTEVTANAQLVYTQIMQDAENKKHAYDILSDSDLNLASYDIADFIADMDKMLKLQDIEDFKRFFNRDIEWLKKYLKKNLAKIIRSIKRIEKLIEYYF